jgi:hypothetical protein
LLTHSDGLEKRELDLDDLDLSVLSDPFELDFHFFQLDLDLVDRLKVS